MSDERRALATREAAANEELPVSKAMATLGARCPACGVERPESAPCPRCGHRSERARWRSWRSERRSVLRATVGSASGEYAMFGVLFAVVAVAVLRSGLARSSLISCAAAAVAAMALPLLVVGVRKAVRVAIKRRWRYESPDGVICIADGTPWAIESTVRVRPLGTSEWHAPAELHQIEPSHASALASRPEVTARMRFIDGGALKGATRERAEACVAVAIALAQMEREGSVRLVRSELLRSSRAFDREPIEEKSVVFGVAARAAGQAKDLGAWLFAAIPKDETERERAHYREASAAVDASAAGGLADLEAVLARRFEQESFAGATATIRTKVNAEGGWHSSAPSLTMESYHWLAELAGCVWDALRTAEHGKPSDHDTR